MMGRKSEDRIAVSTKNGEVLFAVFDGHRSSQVAALASEEVADRLWSSPSWPSAPAEALQGVLRECHEQARSERLKGGSTAVLVATVGGMVWCCNAGDSRAVAGLHGGDIKRLSVDHKGSADDEDARIRAMGGCVEFGRLGGMLEVSRGLGDFDFESDGFTSDAHICSVRRENVEFVVLASDGLWDVVDDEACCALVREWGLANIAERLADHAFKLGSEDDISVIVASFA